jgi:hypothetical protein
MQAAWCSSGQGAEQGWRNGPPGNCGWAAGPGKGWHSAIAATGAIGVMEDVAVGRIAKRLIFAALLIYHHVYPLTGIKPKSLPSA